MMIRRAAAADTATLAQPSRGLGVDDVVVLFAASRGGCRIFDMAKEDTRSGLPTSRRGAFHHGGHRLLFWAVFVWR